MCAPAMRLTTREADAIGEKVRRLDPEAELYLYGSRTDDAARGVATYAEKTLRKQVRQFS